VIITVITGALTIVFIALTAKHISWARRQPRAQRLVSAHHRGAGLRHDGFRSRLGERGSGLLALPSAQRVVARRGVVDHFRLVGRALILIAFGLLLAGSSSTLASAVGNDPVGALANLFAHVVLVPFVIVAILGLVGGAVLDIYSSGLALFSAGLKIPRYGRAGVDGVIMLIGTVYIVFGKQKLPQSVRRFSSSRWRLDRRVGAASFWATSCYARRTNVDADLFQSSGRLRRPAYRAHRDDDRVGLSAGGLVTK